MSSQPIGTSSANQSTLAPAQANGADQQVAQTQAGIAGNGQSSISQAAVGYLAAQQMTRVDPLTGAIDGALSIFRQTPQSQQAQPVSDQTTAVFSGNQPGMSVNELMMVLLAFASERATPWTPAEWQLKSYGYEPSVAQKVLLMKIRDAQAVNARVMQGNNTATKPEEKAAEGKK